MFNDVMDVDECRVLLRALATCTLPFQCAHGRPVLVPLAQLGALGGWRPK
jgi:DNA mismatch repair protein MLH3